jgi:hypothetical protein
MSRLLGPLFPGLLPSRKLLDRLRGTLAAAADC